jgi:uncharacterized membrane protein
MSALRSTVSACAIGATCLFAVSSARADIIFCNNFPHLAYVAIAYPQSDGSGSWVSRGWLNVDTGTCAEFDTALHVKTLYYRGESVSYQQGGKSEKTVWGGNGDAKFAIWENDNFNFWNAQTNALKSSLVVFTQVNATTTGDALSVRVTFEADGIHVTTTTENSPPPTK